MERLTAIVSGRVQLVMYRDFCCRNARGLGLHGEVQNLKDGTVRVVAEGEREKLDRFVLKLWEGSLLSHVANVSISWSAATGEYAKFKINYE